MGIKGENDLFAAAQMSALQGPAVRTGSYGIRENEGGWFLRISLPSCPLDCARDCVTRSGYLCTEMPISKVLWSQSALWSRHHWRSLSILATSWLTWGLSLPWRAAS